MLSINTNLSSLIVQNNLNKSTNALNTAIERMTTGYKLNHAGDNAANYSIAKNMSSKLSSYEVAQDNASMGLDLITTASDNLDLISSHLSRIRDLAEQAANGTYGAQSLQAIQSEVDARIAEINRIVANTEYNGIQLFDGTQPSPEELLQPNERGFLKNVSEIDVSGYTRLSELGEEVRTISSGTYAITTKEDLLRFNNISEITGGTFILGADIDMEGVTQSINNNFDNATFDGNGHTISNMDYALFYTVENSTIKNLGLINSNISSGMSPLALTAYDSTISNCYVDGGSVTGESYFIGGLVACMSGTMEYCWSDIDIDAGAIGIGGLIGVCSNSDSPAPVHISNSFAKGDVSNSIALAAGLIGTGCGTITNCYASGEVSSASENCAAGLINTWQYYSDITGDTPEGDIPPLTINNSIYTGSSSVPQVQGEYSGSIADSEGGGGSSLRTFQVGINGDDSSQISIDTGFNMSVAIDVTTGNGARSALGTIDGLLSEVSTKQTEFGACYNRLESVLESIGVSIDNLTSSRSTIQDADIAQVSSEYIRHQILQQASATLLATANQSPAIALQLI